MEKFDLENFPVSESAKNMIASVSDGFYDNSYVGKWLYEVMGQEYDTAREIAEDILNQLFPETATWGLMYHEIKWGLPVRKSSIRGETTADLPEERLSGANDTVSDGRVLKNRYRV
ncbi:MAG: putative phage tail protein [Anaerosacchariphilus sp.]